MAEATIRGTPLELKTNLAPYVNKRIKVAAVYSISGDFFDRKTCRKVITCCVERPEVEGVIACQHVWVHHADQIINLDGVKKGERVIFTALVQSYPKYDDNSRRHDDYMLTYPEDVILAENVIPAFRYQQPAVVKPQPKPPDLTSVFEEIKKLAVNGEHAANIILAAETLGWKEFQEMVKKVERMAAEIGVDNLKKMLLAFK